MKISTKGRYALRLMLDLALHDTGEPVSLKDIARRQDLSEKYLEQIMGTLHKAGLVSSVRGAGGGYLLRKPADECTVGDILRTTEGSLMPVSCVENAQCERINGCVTNRVWRKLGEAISSVVDQITLSDMVEWERERIEDYVI